MTDDAELLRRYADARDENAFAELVRRHLGLVYHAALRQCGGDAHRAEDVAQCVFTDLALKAGQLARRPVLAGWLYTSTRFAAAQAVRTEARRQAREQAVHAMNEILVPAHPVDESAAEWERLRPVIDDALHGLGERDREAVLLRFFEGRAFAEVGRRLAVSEDAARMRVERALEKLRTALGRRGITSTSAALGLALANQAAAVAPAGVAASVIGTALAGAAAGGSGAAGAWLAFLTMSKIKIGVVSAVIIVATVPAIVEVRAHRVLATEAAALRAGTGDLAQLKKESQALETKLADSTASRPDAEELSRLRARAAVLQKRPAGVTDAGLKPAATWRNRGWATAEAAMETVMWAAHTGNKEELVRNMRWIGVARASAEAAFAKLPEAWRTRHGNADRLMGEFCFGSRGPENDAEVARHYGKTAAYQVIDVTDDPKRGGMRVRRWEQTESGDERERADTFARHDGQFMFTVSSWSERGWQAIIEQIDPATGAFLPRKVQRLDPETGRPLQPQR